MTLLSQLLPVYAAYLLAVASPGPSNMAIMGAAMSHGRAAGLTMAAGVLTGSMVWASLAATGVSALLVTYAHALTALKIAGGLYLIYLAYRAARSALSPDRPDGGAPGTPPSRLALYRRGVLFHLGNPKSILGWVAIMSLGLRTDVSGPVLPAIVGGCLAIGVTVFCGYALVFSTAPMVRAYRRARRWIEGALAVFFGLAGLRLLAARV